MIAAMVAGMAVLVSAIWALGEPPGYSNALVEYGLMEASMSAPMVAWMRYRGHSGSDGLEMTATMLLPMLALVLPAALGAGAARQGDGSIAHDALARGDDRGMVTLMVYRRNRYAQGARG
jgi:hypothetical protein